MSKVSISVCFTRKTQKLFESKVDQYVRDLTDLGSASRNWSVIRTKPKFEDHHSHILTSFEAKFERTGGHDSTADKQLEQVVEILNRNCNKACWSKNPWQLKITSSSKPITEQSSKPKDDIPFTRAKLLSEIEIPDVLIYGSDEEIESHEAFRGIYNRGPYIRTIFSSIRQMIETKGKKRHHTLLWGEPGCAKSHLLSGVRQVLGEGGFYDLNSDATTKAGVEGKLLQLHDNGIGIPPVIFIEEIEKTANEAVTSVWLSILDDRQELRKLNARVSRRIDVNVLVIATANDKELLDSFHGGRPGKPGALSSRFPHKLKVPRPDTATMRRILQREIDAMQGSVQWIEPCIRLSEQLKTNDPRSVISLLDGRDRLMDHSYQDDILAIQENS